MHLHKSLKYLAFVISIIGLLISISTIEIECIPLKQEQRR